MADLRQFEYCVLMNDSGPYGFAWTLANSRGRESLPDGENGWQACDRLGASGWEAVSMTETQETRDGETFASMTIFFKRECG